MCAAWYALEVRLTEPRLAGSPHWRRSRPLRASRDDELSPGKAPAGPDQEARRGAGPARGQWQPRAARGQPARDRSAPGAARGHHEAPSERGDALRSMAVATAGTAATPATLPRRAWKVEL